MGERGDVMESTCPDCSGVVVPRDAYCGTCGAPLTGARRASAYSAAEDDILPLRVPEPPRSRSRGVVRVIASAVAIGLVLILGLGALAVALNQLGQEDVPSTAATGLHRFGAETSSGGEHAAADVVSRAELVVSAAPGQRHARATGRVRVSTHQAAVVEASVPGSHLAVIELVAREVASTTSSGQMAIAKAPRTRSHPGDGTGGVMVISAGDGTGGVLFMNVP